MRMSFAAVGVLVLFVVAGSVSAGGFGKAGMAPAATTPPPDRVYMPSDPWEEAMRAGGEVRLGAGDFYVTEVLELQNSLRVTGMGTDETILRFGSDGGEYGEQMAIFESDAGGGQFYFSDISLMQSNEVPSDLVTVFGNLSAEFDNVAFSLAWDIYFGDPEAEDYYGTGLYIGAGANVRVVNSLAYSNGSHGILVQDSNLFVGEVVFLLNHGSGVLAFDAEITVINSHFANNSVGIEVYGSLPRKFANNTFRDNTLDDVYEAE